MAKKKATITELRIIESDNPPIVRSRYPLEYEPFGARGLKELRRRYGLDKVIAKGKTEFEQILLLRDWVSRRWDHGYCNVSQWSKTGLEYLRRAEKGECFTCAIFAFMLTEVLTAMGFPARNITMAQADTDFIGPDDEIGHCVTEVWSNQFRKWIVLDADAAAHFELNGVPLSALEVRNAWINKQWKKVDFVRGKHIPKVVCMGPPDTPPLAQLQANMKRFVKYNTMEYYHNLEFHTSNRHYTQQNRRPFFLLLWSDENSPPRIVRQNVAMDPTFRVTTQVESDIYHMLNHVHLSVNCPRRAEGTPVPILNVSLETETPWFARFEARIDKRKWQKTPRRFTWNLHHGKNVIEARPVNKFGREGMVTRLVVQCKMG